MMKTLQPRHRGGALFAALLIASCSSGPTAPTATPRATAPTAADGLVQGSAAGDVKNGPIEINLVRVAQANGVPAFYASAGGEYIVLPNREVEIYVQIWTSDTPLQNPNPRLVVDWGVGEKDNTGCGSCRLSRTYSTEGRYKVTVTMDDRVGGVTTRSFVLKVESPENGGTFTFSNNSLITINDNVPATPYPSAINVSGVTGQIAAASVTIYGYSHTFHGDLGIILVAPSGQTVRLMGRTGGGGDSNNATVTFQDGAPAFPSTNFGPGSFTYSPSGSTTFTAYGPAPGPAYGGSFSVLNGIDASGTWRLFVGDYAGQDIGQLAGGWSLTVTTVGSSSVGVVKAGTAGGVSASGSDWDNAYILNYPFQKPDPRE